MLTYADVCPGARLLRSLFVLGLGEGVDKKELKQVLERYGDGLVERCTITRVVERGTVRCAVYLLY